MRRYRAGKTDDLTHLVDIRLMQREESYSSGIYDGGVTAMLLLKDVQVGDTIEYAYTIKGRNPIFGEEYFASFPINWSVPVGRTYIRFIADKKLYHQLQGIDESKLKVTNNLDEYQYSWDQKSIAPIYDEGDYPYWYNPYGVIRFSQYENWKGIVDWAMTIYSMPKIKIKIKNKKLIKLSDKWAKESSNKKEYAEKVIRFAQNNIRYFGIEIGQNSHKPYSPDLVFERKFGDCKDKATLINTLLARQGIEAYPALVSNQTGKAVKERLPQHGAFDHVISTFNIDGKTYWIDGTRRFQYGSLDNINISDFSYALVIKEGNSELTKIDSQPNLSSIKLSEVYNSENYNEPVKLFVEFAYYYDQAENIRDFYAADGIDKLSKSYKNYFSKQHPTIKLVENVVVNDDEINNIFHIKAKFLIPEFWQVRDGRYDIKLYGDLLSSYIEKPNVVDRLMPLARYYPINLEHSIEVNYNDSVDWELENKEVLIESDAIRYARKINTTDSNIKVVHSFHSKQDYVATDNVAEYIKNTTDIRESIFLLCLY